MEASALSNLVDDVDEGAAISLRNAEEIAMGAKAEPIPLPHEIVPTLLAGILFLLVFFALYFSAAVMIPIVMAFTLNFLLQPAMRILIGLRIPKMIAAVVTLSICFGAIVALSSSLGAPAAGWITKAPESLSRLEKRLQSLKKPFEQMQRASTEVDKITESSAPGGTAVTLKGPGLTGIVFSGTRSMITGFFSMFILLFFLLISGDLFLRRLIEILPTLSDKKQAVELSREIERNISSYLVTITIMNIAVGVLTGIASYFCGLSDPILWGAVALFLNFILLLGPLVGIGILSLVGLSTFDSLGQALLPAALYLAIHLTESQLVTPLLLAKRFTLNPVAVIVSLLFWYWMWGVAGAFLAVPVLATVKITCDRIRPLMAFGHFLGVEPKLTSSG
jgi:predicted PurR-regulated permease PerM